MSIKEDFEEPFYCKENPFEVLKELLPRYHIEKFNNLETIRCLSKTLDARSGNSNIKIGNKIWVYGLSIEDFRAKNGLGVFGNLKDYKLNINMKNNCLDKGAEIIEGFIRKYLIQKEIIDSGYSTVNWQYKETIHKYGKQKLINYLKERKKNADTEKEKYLEDILHYGIVLFGDDFNLKKLTKMSKRIIKSMPTKIHPTNIDYHTLKPSKHIF